MLLLIHIGSATPTWTAVIGWSLDGATASAGDTFTLDMPCVFKFITDQTSIDLVADGRTYATCNLILPKSLLLF